MRVEWYGQSAFLLQAQQASVAIDPFADLSALSGRVRFDYPPIRGARADLVLVTHEHADHNGVEAIDGEPAIVRSAPGTHDSPVGQLTVVASEHDEQAGTARGANTIVAFELEGLRVCHFGDFGQSGLREEQATAIGAVDLLFLPVGAGPTIGPEQAALIVERVRPRWIVPMHYRTRRIDFLDPPDAFLERYEYVRRLDQSAFDTRELEQADAPLVLVPTAP